MSGGGDWRMKINNWLQAKGEDTNLFVVTYESMGPANNSTWSAVAKYKDIECGKGTGRDKPSAKENACKQAMKTLDAKRYKELGGD